MPVDVCEEHRRVEDLDDVDPLSVDVRGQIGGVMDAATGWSSARRIPRHLLLRSLWVLMHCDDACEQLCQAWNKSREVACGE